jgi:hypothetical protein
VRRFVAAAVTIAALTGCGVTHGTATVWVTRDRGANVLLVRHVPAGLTAMQGLERVAHVQTRYAGRFVQAIDGISGSLAHQHDWFYFVNGYEADRSAAEYRLHPGDVEWWDYRSWKSSMTVPVVVGAFPEPFLHGYDGKRLPTVVAGPAGFATRAVARLVHADRVVSSSHFVATGENVLALVSAPIERFTARLSSDRPGGPVVFTYWGSPAKLARDPGLARFRYSIP